MSHRFVLKTNYTLVQNHIY